MATLLEPVEANEYLDSYGDYFLLASDHYGTVESNPDSHWDLMEQLGTESPFYQRDRAVTEFGWSIPTPAVTQYLAQFSPLVDFGAGLGYWAYRLEAAGADVIAFDKDPEPDNPTQHLEKHPSDSRDLDVSPWFNVQQALPPVLTDYSNRALFLSWPPYGTPMAADALNAYEGDVVIYVGEGDGGCTGDDEFHSQLRQNWTLRQTLRIPQWPSLNDYISIYTRTPMFNPQAFSTFDSILLR